MQSPPLIPLVHHKVHQPPSLHILEEEEYPMVGCLVMMEQPHNVSAVSLQGTLCTEHVILGEED